MEYTFLSDYPSFATIHTSTSFVSNKDNEFSKNQNIGESQSTTEENQIENGVCNLVKPGRRPKWHGLRGRKTEDICKWWYRRYRKHIQANQRLIYDDPDQSFWDNFLECSREPGKQNPTFKSFSNKYKNHLKTNRIFVEQMQLWFLEKGINMAKAKFKSDSEYAETLCRYAQMELMDFYNQPYWKDYIDEDFLDDIWA